VPPSAAPNEQNVLASKRHEPALKAVANFEEFSFARYDSREGILQCAR
jgi:hypothetical protein